MACDVVARCDPCWSMCDSLRWKVASCVVRRYVGV